LPRNPNPPLGKMTLSVGDIEDLPPTRASRSSRPIAIILGG